MGNCLKTQLKASVNNDNLEYLDKLVFKFTGNITTNSKPWVFGGVNVELTIDDGAFYYNDDNTTYKGTSWKSTTNDFIYFKVQANAGATLTIKNFYNLSGFNVPASLPHLMNPIDVERIKYVSGMKNFGMPLNGNIENLGAWKNLGYFFLLYTVGNVYGDLVTYGKKLAESGITTNEIWFSINGQLNQITVNNKEIVADPVLHNSFLVGEVRWSIRSTDKMFWKNITSKKLVTYGYTDEEIAANIAGTGTEDWSSYSSENVTKV